MTFMLERASAADVPVRRQDFARHGKTVPVFRGAADWSIASMHVPESDMFNCSMSIGVQI
jgi:hypothetical protein